MFDFEELDVVEIEVKNEVVTRSMKGDNPELVENQIVGGLVSMPTLLCSHRPSPQEKQRFDDSPVKQHSSARRLMGSESDLAFLYAHSVEVQSQHQECLAPHARAPSCLPASPAIASGFLEFPANFFVGTATSAYQIEGGSNKGGRKPSIWDEFSKRPGTTNDQTGDVACDHYHRFKDDVAIMSHLGLKTYRFSISWSRVIPDGEGPTNPEGLSFYSELIDELLAHGITPWATLYHWDLPLTLQSRYGGWLGDKKRLTRAFGEFARICFKTFGDRVKHWITINEPFCVSIYGYHFGIHAPGRDPHEPTSARATNAYVVAHNLILAHAEAVNIYRTEFKASQEGQVGITLNIDWRRPRNPNSPDDVAAAQRSLDFYLGWFADPIFFGDYPSCMRETCGARLPSFTREEQVKICGSCDFFGLNSYTCAVVSSANRSKLPEGFLRDCCVAHKVDKTWETTDMGWPVVPWGFREILMYVHRRYAPPGGIIVTENGCALESGVQDGAQLPKPGIGYSHMDNGKSHTNDPGVTASFEPKVFIGASNSLALEALEENTYHDPSRTRFFEAHLSAVHAAITMGADIRGYFAWSLLDNFEWGHGYSKRFGIVHVDYETQRRTIKASGRFIANVIRDGGFMAPPRSHQFQGTLF